jgi:hypothetical protein
MSGRARREWWRVARKRGDLGKARPPVAEAAAIANQLAAVVSCFARGGNCHLTRNSWIAKITEALPGSAVGRERSATGAWLGQFDHT